MKYKLNIKLVSSYLFLSLILVITLALIINVSFETQFKKYVINIQQEKTENVVSNIIDEYKKDYQNVNKETLEMIGVRALEEGLIIKVVNNNNEVVWDAMEHNSGMCVEMLEKMAANMKKIYPNFKGTHTQDDYLIEDNGIIYGKANIGYYGPYYFNDNDITFLKTFNKMIVGITILSVILSLAFGIMTARKITSNITKVVKATKDITLGNYNLQIKDDTDIIEINDLINSINSLAKTLDNQTTLRKKLTVDIAHELRTPIAVLQSHLEALKDGVWIADEKRIESLYDEVSRLSKIINNLDKLNEYDNKVIPLHRVKFDVNELINKIILNFEKQINDKKINIKVIGEKMFLNADKDQMTSVIVNLLSNAIKYMNGSGDITINLKKANNRKIIEVSDNGIGIEKKHLPYIFERFYRVDDSRARETGGTGIGLSIVKSIIDAHGGTIEVRSKYNNGTTFIITFKDEKN